MNEEDKLAFNRILDIANNCYNRNIPTATDFIDLHMQSVFKSNMNQLPPVCSIAMGGYDLAERKQILFLPYEDFPYEPPYDIVRISPVTAKFFEELGHRDFLGSLMGLGLTRAKFGDIIVDNNCAYVFCTKGVTKIISDNLIKIKNTQVKIELVDAINFSYKPKTEEIIGSVASLRIDCLIALGFKESRSHLISYIENGQVYVNGQLITTNAYNLKENDIISLRKKGRIQFVEVLSSTKKGRIMVKLNKFI